MASEKQFNMKIIKRKNPSHLSALENMEISLMHGNPCIKIILNIVRTYIIISANSDYIYVCNKRYLRVKVLDDIVHQRIVSKQILGSISDGSRILIWERLMHVQNINFVIDAYNVNTNSNYG